MKKKTSGRKPGRPPKPVEDKLAQLSVRLSAQYKIALEVFAADSGLSLSAAVDLAVGNLLASQKLSNGMTPEEVVSSIQTQPLPLRLMELYDINPRFLEFQDRALIESIYSAHEFVEANRDPDPAARQRDVLEAKKFVIDNWRDLQAALKSNWAKQRKGYSLRALLSPPEPPGEFGAAESLFRKTA